MTQAKHENGYVIIGDYTAITPTNQPSVTPYGSNPTNNTPYDTPTNYPIITPPKVTPPTVMPETTPTITLTDFITNKRRDVAVTQEGLDALSVTLFNVDQILVEIQGVLIESRYLQEILGKYIKIYTDNYLSLEHGYPLILNESNKAEIKKLMSLLNTLSRSKLMSGGRIGTSNVKRALIEISNHAGRFSYADLKTEKAMVSKVMLVRQDGDFEIAESP